MKLLCAFLALTQLAAATVVNFDRPISAVSQPDTHIRVRRDSDDDKKKEDEKKKEEDEPTDKLDKVDEDVCKAKIHGLKDKIGGQTTVFSLKDKNPSVAIAWHGKNTGTLLAVTTKEFVAFDLMGKHEGLEPGKDKVRPSRVYYSTNYGKSFKEVEAIKDTFSMGDDEPFYIKKSHGVITNNINTNRVMLIEQAAHINTFGSPDDGPKKGTTIWINENVSEWAKNPNSGKSWHRVSLPFTLDGSYLEQHPANEKLMLAVGVSKDDDRTLYITSDGGLNWNPVAKNVHRYRWDPKIRKGSDAKHDGFYYTTDPTQMFQASQFHYELYRGEGWTSKDKGENLLLAINVYSFGVQDKYLYVSVKYQPTEGDEEPERIMLVSTMHGENLQAVQLPNISRDRFYAILDAHEGMIFLHVDDEGDTGFGTIYTSDEGGKIFDRSLQFHLYPNTGDLTDFYKVDAFGAEGTYITSKLMTDDSNSVQTVITYDKGVGWYYITEDMIENIKELKDQGRCKDDTCNLQLHNRFSLSKKVHIPSTPLSSKAAPGLIIAHGNLGDALASDRVDVYLSEDGGYHWRRALEGPHHFQIMDQGGIIVAVPSPEAGTTMVDTVKISFDMGKCWIDHKFTKEKEGAIEYTGMIVEPGERQAKLSIWGWGNITADDPMGHWMVYHVDLSKDIVDKCTEDDFDEFQAHCNPKSKGGYKPHKTDEKTDENEKKTAKGNCCRLGQEISWKILKTDRYCSVGTKYRHEDSFKSEQCLCVMIDYQCGFGYMKRSLQTSDLDDIDCVEQPTKGIRKIGIEHDICWMQNDATAAVEFVNSIPSYAYRKIPGDVCKGGFETQVKVMKSTMRKLNCEVKKKAVMPVNENVKWDSKKNELVSEKIDADCKYIDSNGNCKKKSFYADLLMQEEIDKFNKKFPDARITASTQGGGHHVLWILVGLTCIAALAGATYHYYYKGNRLPGVFSQYVPYSRLPTGSVTATEDEPPLNLFNDNGYDPMAAEDPDDILA